MEPGDIPRRIYDLFLKRPMNVSFIDDWVSGSARPFSRRSVLFLKEKLGVQSILSLTENGLRPDLVEGFQYEHVPVRNHVAPTLDQLNDSVQFLLAESANNRKVVVHCAAGMGRTGTVLAAYLCAKYNYPAAKAIAVVREKRPGSIEPKQEGVLQEYAARSQRI